MKKTKYEKKSFLNFFLGYFISVSVFILLLGYLYFAQQKVFVLQQTAMNMHHYFMGLMSSNLSFTKGGYSYEKYGGIKRNNQLPQKDNFHYIKSFRNGILIKIDKKIVDDKLNSLIKLTISVQLIVILLFALISWILAKRSLRPMIQALSYLDRFTKDLIHDLNTPISSILINTKMLKKDCLEQDIKKIERIEKSANYIISLYDNLNILLDQNTLKKEEFNLSNLLNEIIETYKSIYPQISFKFTQENIIILSNQNAIKRIIDNIIQNSCKYKNNTNPNINISYLNHNLIIQDNGKGIKHHIKQSKL